MYFYKFVCINIGYAPYSFGSIDCCTILSPGRIALLDQPRRGVF